MIELVVSSIAIVLINVSLVPQIVHNYKTKSTKDFSWIFLTIMISGLSLWGVYAGIRYDYMLALNQIIGVGLWIVVLVQKYKYGRHRI